MRFYDNTMISDYSTCERMHYFRHERGWRPEETRLPLAFGAAWHKAMDVIWHQISTVRNLDKSDLVLKGMVAFEKEWCGEFGQPSANEFLQYSDEEQKKFLPRSPTVAMEMLYHYVETRMQFIKECKILSIDIPFIVPLDPNNPELFYAGKVDKVVEHRYKIYGIEHKTSTMYRKNGPFRDDFMESFSPNRQVDGYLHSIHMQHGDKTKAVYVDAALVHRDHHDQFRFIPVEKAFAQLDSWLWETLDRIDRLERDKARLAAYREQYKGKHAAYLPAFPKQTGACTLYGRCSYLDLCRMSANPEKDWPKAPPSGFVHEPWSPFEELHLEKLFPKKKAKKPMRSKKK